MPFAPGFLHFMVAHDAHNGMETRVIAKSHVHGYTRVVNGKVIYVPDFENKVQAGQDVGREAQGGRGVPDPQAPVGGAGIRPARGSRSVRRRAQGFPMNFNPGFSDWMAATDLINGVGGREIEKSHRTPKGGQHINGKDYLGGQFAPGDHAAASDAEIEKGRAAMERVISDKVDVPSAFERPGVGGITLIWGAEGKTPGKSFAESTQRERAKAFKGGRGVSKIIAKRAWEGRDGDAFARLAIDILGHGIVSPDPAGKGRIRMTLGNCVATLAPERNGKPERWLLTAFELYP